jgi:hypothetical protein
MYYDPIRQPVQRFEQSDHITARIERALDIEEKAALRQNAANDRRRTQEPAESE